MTEQVGTIISSEDLPTTNRCEFIITDMDDPVQKEEFIEFDTEQGKALARVASVRKTNQYFMEAQSVNEYEKNGQAMNQLFPSDDWEVLVAEAEILGVYNNEKQERSTFPPSPGTPVTRADTDRLQDFLGVTDHGITLGTVKHEDLAANLDMTKLLQKHVAVLAMSGAGKSYLSAVMLEELMDRNPEDGQVATVVIDPHGEYAGLAQDPEYQDRVDVVTGDDIKIGVSSVHPGTFATFLGDLSNAQQRGMRKVMKHLYSEWKTGEGSYGLQQIIEQVEEEDSIKTSTKQVLLEQLESMKSMDLFGHYDFPTTDQVEPGKVLVFDLSDIIHYRKKQIIVSYFAKQLFWERRKGNLPPFFLLLEEAHNFAPENNPDAIARRILTQIAREGRKFHACLGLISQRPVGLSNTILSQCNTHVIMRVSNPYDLDRIRESSEGITRDILDDLPGLRVGEAIVVGEAVNHPVFVNVRKRRSEEFETGQPLTEAAQNYIQSGNEGSDDVEAFM